MIVAYKKGKKHKDWAGLKMASQEAINEVCEFYGIDVKREREENPGEMYNPELMALRMKGIILKGY